MEKIILLYSGGLDSRIAAIELKKKYNPLAIFFKLPFACDRHIKDNFLKNQNIKLKIFDCTKGKLFKEYLEIIKNPKYGNGKGINPCIDCKIFMIKKSMEYAKSKNIDKIATGEVIDQRPMSQTSKALKIIDQNLDFKILRPLKGIAHGRQRKTQIKIAEKENINYPTPSGGCLLCEKALKKRFEILLKKDLIKQENYKLAKIGRHFLINNNWFVVGRDEQENKIIEEMKNTIKSGKGKPSVYFHNKDENEKALEIQKAYKDKDKKKLKILQSFKL